VTDEQSRAVRHGRIQSHGGVAVELTDSAYAHALRRGLIDSSLDLEWDLGKEMNGLLDHAAPGTDSGFRLTPT
jgi:hypothetical protein